MSVYLDHAATTPMDAAVVEAMLPFFTDNFGNPSGSHTVARRARVALDDARDEVAEVLGCASGEIVFTSGGTEADNLAIGGRCAKTGGVAVALDSDHDAARNSVIALGGRLAPVTPTGDVDYDALTGLLGRDVTVVSVALANNETGIVLDLAALAQAVAGHAEEAVLHTDAVQAARWVDLAQAAAPAGLVSVAAHKLGGPKGVGALVVRDGVALAPTMYGGGQERDRRSGTHNVAGAVGLARALSLAAAERESHVAATRARRDRLEAATLAALDGVTVTGADSNRLPNISHLRIAGVESEALLILLDRAGVCASAGSACASGALEPSHVLLAMGVPADECRGVLRCSLAPSTTDADIDAAVAALTSAVTQLRSRERVTN